MIAGFRQHDPDVRQGRLDEDRRDVLVRERSLERGDIVERDDPVVRAGSTAGPMFSSVATTPAVGVERGEGLVDRAVIALVVDDDLLTGR